MRETGNSIYQGNISDALGSLFAHYDGIYLGDYEPRH